MWSLRQRGKREKAIWMTCEQVEMSLLNHVPRILECGNNMVATDISRSLADEEKMLCE